MSGTGSSIKRVKLKELLAARITGGEFSYGDRFPGLHQLCQQYNTSYVTVSRAMKLLEKEGYVQAQNGVGYFVCYVRPDIVSSQKIVNFITSLSSEAPQWHIVNEGKRLFEESGWEVRVLTLPRKDFSSCVPMINSPDAYSVLFYTRIKWENFAATFGHVVQRVVVIGQLSGNTDVCSIISDEYETIRRCIEYFRSRKRFKTGIVVYQPEQELEMLRVAAWRRIMSSYGFSLKELDQLCFSASQIMQGEEKDIVSVYSNWLRIAGQNMDSIIYPPLGGSLPLACKKTALRVPEDIEIITIASDPQEKTDSIPVLDHNLSGHFQCALEILEERFRTGRKTPGAWHLIPPGDIC